MRFAEGDSPVDQLRCPRDDKQRLAILLDLRVLMGLTGILDRQIMQPKLRLHALQEIGARLPQSDPHDVPRPLRPFARFLNGDILDAASAGINARGDDTGFAVARRRSRRVCSGVHSFPSAARLFCLREYSPFARFCRLPQRRPTPPRSARAWHTQILASGIYPAATGAAGWGGRTRTSEWRNQNPLPYHLATPHEGRLLAPPRRGP